MKNRPVRKLAVTVPKPLATGFDFGPLADGNIRIDGRESAHFFYAASALKASQIVKQITTKTIKYGAYAAEEDSAK